MSSDPFANDVNLHKHTTTFFAVADVVIARPPRLHGVSPTRNAMGIDRCLIVAGNGNAHFTTGVAFTTCDVRWGSSSWLLRSRRIGRVAIDRCVLRGRGLRRLSRRRSLCGRSFRGRGLRCRCLCSWSFRGHGRLGRFRRFCCGAINGGILRSGRLRGLGGCWSICGRSRRSWGFGGHRCFGGDRCFGSGRSVSAET